MAAPPLPPHALQLFDSLQASLNAALLEVAYSVKNPARPQLNHIAVANANPQNLPGPKYANPALTLHLDRFHLSLDDLERHLFRAQSVLRRDVAVHRAAREAREAEEARAAAEEAQKQKDALEQEEQQKKAAAAAAAAAVAAAAAAAAQSKAAAAAPPSLSPTMHRSANQDNDVTMTGTDAFTALPSTAAHTAATSKTLSNMSANKPLAVETNAASNAHTGGAPDTAGTTTGSDDLFGPTPTTAGLNATDLDSMFDDLTNEQDNGGGHADNQQGDIDFALLPGLETYANIDSGGDKQQQRAENTEKELGGASDMFDFGLGSTDQSQKQNQGQQQQTSTSDNDQDKAAASNQDQKQNQGQQQQTSTSDNNQDKAAASNQDQKHEQDQQPQHDADAFNPDSYANDSTFDDMFNYADFDLGGDAAADGTGADTAFDDDFFNI